MGRQILEERSLGIKKSGPEAVFSTYEVLNRQTRRTYRVVIRGEALGLNSCSCPDFSVNTLGTCKHVEAVLFKLRRDRETGIVLKKGYRAKHCSVILRHGARRQIFFLEGSATTPALKRLVGRYFDSEGYLSKEGFRRFDEWMAATKRLRVDVRHDETALDFIAQVRDQEIRRRRIDDVFLRKGGKEIWSRLLKCDLYPYQKEGVLFAAKAGRTLLADDMGLGKTAQAIGTAQIMGHCLGVERVLVVCPNSLKYQWQQEIIKFTHRSVEVIQGFKLKRRLAYQTPTFFKVVNYDSVHHDYEAISAWGPDLIILDEAQRIKNWKTRRARAVKSLVSPYALVLTGTPLENRLEELHSILEFVDRYHLGPLFRFLDRHQTVDGEGRVVGYRDLHQLGRSLAPILLRRRKEEILRQLPKRTDKNHLVPMTREQSDIHEEYRLVVARLVAKWQKYHFLSEEDQRRMMRTLQSMRMVCDNTYLLDERTIKGKKIDELEALLGEILEKPETKVVIFSQWLRMGELVTSMLNGHGWKHTYLHGGLSVKQRHEAIRRFKEDPDLRIFLSTDMGGTGLNLQQASVVINLDLPWNPAVLEQRISRVHRMGQKRSVRVINLIAEETIEHGMLNSYRFKRSTFSGVLDGGEDRVFMEGGRFTQFMKTVEKATVPIDEKPATGGEDYRKGDKERISEGDSGRELVDLGMAVFSKLTQAFLSGEKTRQNGHPLFQLKKDAASGKQVLQIALPDGEKLKKLKGVLSLFKDALNAL